MAQKFRKNGDSVTIEMADKSTITVMLNGKMMDTSAFAPDSIGQKMVEMTERCIDFIKEGRVPYIYTSVYVDGVKYGVSLSLHYGTTDKGMGIFPFVIWYSDAPVDKELVNQTSSIPHTILTRRGLYASNSFAAKVKRFDLNPIMVNYITTFHYHNTAA
jgi:hypothetical protein